MVADDISEIHAVELVTGKNKEEVVFAGTKMKKVLTHCISSTLVPVATCLCLFSGKNIYESTTEAIKFVGCLYMVVQRRSIKLGEQVDLIHTGV